MLVPLNRKDDKKPSIVQRARDLPREPQSTSALPKPTPARSASISLGPGKLPPSTALISKKAGDAALVVSDPKSKHSTEDALLQLTDQIAQAPNFGVNARELILRATRQLADGECTGLHCALLAFFCLQMLCSHSFVQITWARQGLELCNGTRLDLGAPCYQMLLSM